MKLKSNLSPELKYQAVVIEATARDAGLDFLEVEFELLSAADVNGVAAYGGFPVRYPSWRFGMEYERLQKGYRWGLSKIYELVINNDPTIAYLVSSNSLLEQKLVMAHVYGHADFFKHNVWFAPTDRAMLDTMGHNATRVRRYIDAHGQESVERHMDRCLSIESLIDPYLPLREHGRVARPRPEPRPLSERSRAALEAMTASRAGGAKSEGGEEASSGAQEELCGRLPTYDVMGFLMEHAPLETWERKILRMLRKEAYYFAPQRMTKIMNEGWASFWHSRLLTGGLLDPSEVVQFADVHSSATYSPPGQLNPYKLGIELFRYAESRGEDIFRLRRVHNDVSLIDELIDEGFVLHSMSPEAARRMQEQGMSFDWGEQKEALLRDIAWGGQPRIELRDVGGEGDGELLLVHRHDGRDLQLDQAAQTLRHMEGLWRAPVHLLTLEEGEGRRLVCDRGELKALDSVEARGACHPGEADANDEQADSRAAG